MENILIVVDMQKSFIDGTFAALEAQIIIPKEKKELIQHLKSGQPITFKRDAAFEQQLADQEGKFIPISHCLSPNASRIHDKKKYIVLQTKITESANPDAQVLTEHIGLCSGFCVFGNSMLVKTACPQITITTNAEHPTLETYEAVLSNKILQIKR